MSRFLILSIAALIALAPVAQASAQSRDSSRDQDERREQQRRDERRNNDTRRDERSRVSPDEARRQAQSSGRVIDLRRRTDGNYDALVERDGRVREVVVGDQNNRRPN